jgi:predicted TPR repeat methyltransferase
VGFLSEFPPSAVPPTPPAHLAPSGRTRPRTPPTIAAMAAFEEYSDPRLVALYDLWGPTRADTAFYIGLAAELAASSIVDIGCGTGLRACELARRVTR